MPMKITKSTKAIDAMQMSEKAITIFEKHNLYCPRCKGVVEESIEKVALNNGIDLKDFLDELNSALG